MNSRLFTPPARLALVGLAALGLGSGCGGSTGAPAPAGGPSRSGPATPGSTHPPGSSRPTALPPSGSRPALPRLTSHVAAWQLPASRSRSVAVAGGAGLLVAGGLDAAKVSTDTVWSIDPASGRLVSTGRLATAVHDATGFALGGAAYVVAGGNTSTVDQVQRLSAGGTSTAASRLPRPRSDLVSVATGGAAYVLAGFDGTTSLSEVLKTTDARTWSVVARLPVPVRYPAVAAVGGRLLLFGGEHDGVPVDDVQAVDPAAGTARIVGHLPEPLAHEAAITLDGVVWLAGGRSHDVIQSSVWRWDDTARRAVRAGRLPYAVADAGCAVVGGTAYLVGGERPDPTDTVITLTAH